MFDAHTHLNSDQLYPDREIHLGAFQDAWWTWLINVWVNHIWNQRVLEIAQKVREKSDNIYVWSTIWLHPWETTFGNISSKEVAKIEIEKLHTLFYENKKDIIAIWECGIDSHFERNSTIQSLQEQLFLAQCELARKESLPLVIHSRDNFALTHDILKNYTDLKIYFHCRWYGPKEVEQAKETFPHLRIWFCGNLTYPKAHLLRDSFQQAKNLWVKIVLETDAPYLSPQATRGKQNSPKNIVHLYDYVAEKFGLEKEKIIWNIKSLYNIKEPLQN